MLMSRKFHESCLGWISFTICTFFVLSLFKDFKDPEQTEQFSIKKASISTNSIISRVEHVNQIKAEYILSMQNIMSNITFFTTYDFKNEKLNLNVSQIIVQSFENVSVVDINKFEQVSQEIDFLKIPKHCRKISKLYENEGEYFQNMLHYLDNYETWKQYLGQKRINFTSKWTQANNNTHIYIAKIKKTKIYYDYPIINYPIKPLFLRSKKQRVCFKLF